MLLQAEILNVYFKQTNLKTSRLSTEPECVVSGTGQHKPATFTLKKLAAVATSTGYTCAVWVNIYLPANYNLLATFKTCPTQST